MTDLRTDPHVVRATHHVPVADRFDAWLAPVREAHRIPGAHIRMHHTSLTEIAAAVLDEVPDDWPVGPDGSSASFMAARIVVDNDVPRGQWQVCSAPFAVYVVPTIGTIETSRS